MVPRHCTPKITVLYCVFTVYEIFSVFDRSLKMVTEKIGIHNADHLVEMRQYYQLYAQSLGNRINKKKNPMRASAPHLRRGRRNQE